MRLLHCSDDGRLTFTTKLVSRDTIPQYAILSHTWEKDQEVSYKEFTEGNGINKAGYKKILLCAEQAKRDGLEYFWVDTCCINKADQVELREAISSMFNWYRHASKCYVFLSDVQYSKRKADTEPCAYPWTTAFLASRWFTRGWTLQELIAPRSLEFFSKEWRKLGDKASLQTYICEATRIPTRALQGVPLSQFTIEERLKWSEHRETTEPEDRVYCLIGILGVQMTPFYGEGAHGAFTRLMSEANVLKRCLQDMHISNPYDDKRRIEDTKGGLLQGLCYWVLKNNSFRQWCDNSQSRLLWIKGDAGKGKTMLVCGIVDELKNSTTALLSFFFCQGTDARINNATSVLRGVISQLVSQQPSLMSHLREKYDRAGRNLFQDANAWVALSDIFTSMTEDDNIKTNYVIVDGLDECVVDLPKLLDLIVRTTAASSQIKWLVSSRNEAHIEQKFKSLSDKSKLSLELKQNAEHVAQAVDIYIDHKLSRIDSLEEDILRERVRDELRRKANGTFLWVALVVEELEKPESWDPLAVVEEAPAGLHQLYDRMINQIQRLSPKTADTCRFLLCTAAVAYRPLYVVEIGSLRRLPCRVTVLAETVRKIVAMCGSFLTIRDEQVYLVHQSAKDYLSDKMRATALPSYNEIHYDMYTQSLELMSGTLKRDMYALYMPGISIDKVGIPNPDPLVTVHYSCVYWVDHLSDSQFESWTASSDGLKARNAVDKFMREKYLYWLEFLSLSKNTAKGGESMARLFSLVEDMRDAGELTKLVRDAHRFFMYHKGAFESYPLQLYASALLFSPRDSLVRQSFQHEAPDWIALRPEMKEKWSACLQTLEDPCNMATFSRNSRQLALASRDKTVKILDAVNGTYLKTLEGHQSPVHLVRFSSDSTRLASVSQDGTGKIWDVNSGNCLSAFPCDLELLVFSNDLARVAVTTFTPSQTVQIRDLISGECSSIIPASDGELFGSLAFSHTDTWLAIVSYSVIKIWDCNNNKYIQTFQNHGNPFSSLAFSYDSALLASGFNDGMIRVFNVNSDEVPQVLDSHTRRVTSVAFSHDSTRLASASDDYTVKIWDLRDATCLQTFDGHNGPVQSVAFSCDSKRLASVAKDDGFTKIWDTSGGERMEMPDDHDNLINSVAFSLDSTRLASSSDDSTVKLWDSSGKCLQTLRGHSSSVIMSVFSHDSVWLASASSDMTARLWDVISGRCLLTYRGHSGKIVSITFSHDSQILASVSIDRTIKLWNVSSGKLISTLARYVHEVLSVAFSHDSTQLASLSIFGVVKVLSVRSGECLQTLDRRIDALFSTSIAFSRDATQLAIVTPMGGVRIWEWQRGKCLHAIRIGQPLSKVSFHASGLYLSSEIGLIPIPATSDPDGRVAAPDHQSTPHHYAGLSEDGKWITYNSVNVLWLPSEYRPSHSDVSGNVIGMAVGNRVFVATLSRNCPC